MALPRRSVPLIALPVLIAAALFVRAWAPDVGQNIPAARLVYQGKSQNSLHGVEYCLLANWTGALNLRKKLAPPPVKLPVVRVDNPVRHLVVDVYDEGLNRKLFAYSRHGEDYNSQLPTS